MSIRTFRRLNTNRRTVAPRARLFLAALERREVPAVFTVDLTSDFGAISSPTSGDLRYCIDQANLTPGADSIVFDKTAFGSAQTITLTSGEFAITGDTTITGPGAALLTIDANASNRHFNISDDATTTINVSLSGMTLINGKAPVNTGVAPYPVSAGGSILVRNDKLTLDSMIITGNSSGTAFGGGAIAVGLSAVPQQFNGSGQGGSLIVNNCEISNNTAVGLGSNGGGIYFNFPNGFAGGYGNIFSIANSTVAGNVAGKRGGGIYFNGNASDQRASSFSMHNTTVSGNSSLNEFAGGVLIASTTNMPMTIANSTITRNVSMNSPGGGGLVLNTGTGTISIDSSIIADNTGTASAPDIYTNSGATINASNNIIGSKSGISSSTIYNDRGNYYGSANLAPLTYNGGATRTHLPAYNSPSLNVAAVTVTTLTLPINNGFTGTSADNAVTVASNAGIAIGSYILIDSEVMLVTGVSGGTGLTVDRGQLGTFSSTHQPGRAVNLGATALTTLSADALVAATSVTVSNASRLSAGSFIAIDTEIVQITAISGTTLTLATPLGSSHTIGAGVNAASSVQTTISQAANVIAGDTTIGVASPIGIVPGTKLQIDSEVVAVSGLSTVQLTTLPADITSSQSSVTAASSAGLFANMFAQIDNEIVQVTAITNIATTLTASITASDTSMKVASATGISAGSYLLIGSEYVLVTLVSGTNLAITRGQVGTTAAAHTGGDAVTSVKLTLSRGQQGTVGAAHIGGAALVQNRVTVVRGQDSTTDAGHDVGRALMWAYDQRGTGYARRMGTAMDAGGIEVNPNTPAAIATTSNITVGGGATGTFTVTYSAAAGIKASTVFGNNAAVRVTGPGGFDVAATFVGIDNNTDGSPRTATYTFNAPGTWDYVDNGVYDVVLQPAQVTDTGLAAVPSSTVGQFGVSIGRSLVVTVAADSGAGTLRDALDLANQNVFAVDTITFDTTSMGASIIGLAGTWLDITDPVVINGPGITVDGANASRVFNVDGPGNIAVTFNGLTIQNGQQPVTQFDSGIGGGIRGFDEIITLNDTYVTGNTGGGVALYSVITSGGINISNSTISNNVGGGVLSLTSPFGIGHDVSIQNSSILDNSGSGFSGRTSSFNLANSTIAGNTGATRGGGINIVGFFNSKGNSIVNSTISGNSAANSGGGIYMYWSSNGSAGQRVLIANTTIANNQTNGGFINEPGGGVSNKATTDNLVDFENTVIAGNTNSTVPDMYSKSAVLMNNSFLGVYQPTYFAINGSNNQLGSKASPISPFLGPLQNNGGSTKTMMPYAGSPLVDVTLATPTLSTLTYPMSTSATGFYVAAQTDLANFVANQYLQINSESMRVVGTSMSPVTSATKSLTNSDTTVYVQDPLKIVPNMNLTIDSEVVTVTAVNNLSLTTLAFPVVSTSATSLSLASTAGIASGMYLIIDAENFRVTAVNNIATTLTAAITASATSIPVASGTGITNGMVLQIENEYVTVTAGGGTPTLTVTRGQKGSTAAAHAISLDVTNSVTVTRGQNQTVAALHNTAANVSTGTATITRGQQGSTAAAHSAAASMSAPFVSVNSFILGNFRGQLNTAVASHAAGATVLGGYVPPADDQRGAGYPRAANGKVEIGAVEVDPNIPAAVLTAPIPVINAPGLTPVTFQVTFSDNTAIDVSTLNLNSNAIRVTGPNGYNQLATFQSIDVNTNGTPRVVTYTVTAPGPNWTVNDNGVYTISVEPNQVTDTGATPVQAHAIGTFRVGLAQTLIVTNDADSGPGSLRNAVELANINADVPETITFDASYFSTPRTITLTNGELYLSDQVTIVGPGAGFATLKGTGTLNGGKRIFTIDTPSNQTPILISGLTMTGGNGDSTVNAGVTPGGGGILNVDEALSLTNVVITKNDTTGSLGFDSQPTTSAYGGGILLGNALATLTLQDSVISDNSAGASGGGISVRYGCLVTIDGCTISGNTAGYGVSLTSGAAGGGLSASLGFSSGSTPTPTIQLTNTTFANNVAGQGGGLQMGNGVSSSKRAFLTAVNCTFVGNVATGLGTGTSNGNGGALSIGTSTNWTLQNCTVTGNYARVGGGGLQIGNSISSPYGTTNGAIINTVIAGNNNKATPDIVGGSSTTPWTLPVVNSIIGAVDTSLTKINNIGSLIGTPGSPIDPMLMPLATNGGLIQTVMPLPGSPVINAGTATPAVTLTTLSADVTSVSATTISVAAAAGMQVGQYIQIDSEAMLITAVSGTTVTVTRGELSTTAATHTSGAAVNRAVNIAVPATDARGTGYARQIGTIDIGAVEVDPTKPVAFGTFSPVLAPGAATYTFNVTFADDVGMSMATINGNNSAIRVTGPGGFNQLATFKSVTPGTGSTSETATYEITPPGGSWDGLDDGLYSISVEPGQVGDGTNFVFPSTLGSFQVGIPRSFVVTNTNDSGTGSLRQAVLDANANAGTTDVITFDTATFNTPQIIYLLSEVAITDPVTITGTGSSNVMIDGNVNGRLFNISMPAQYWGDTVAMTGMTLQNGYTINSQGACLVNDSAALTLDDVIFSSNVTNTSAGALWVASIYASPTNITNSKFLNNTAFGGAGIYIANNTSALTTVPNTVELNVSDTTFSFNNSAFGGSNGGSGAGIYALSGTKVTVMDSTFDGNVVGTSGGAIFVNGGTLNVVNSTFTGNAADNVNSGSGQGGAIFLGSAAGTNATITNSTISGNHAGNGIGVSTGAGGGIFASTSVTLNIEGSTLSGNAGNSTSTTNGGGALYMTGTAKVTVSNSTFSGNTAQGQGAGIFLNSLTLNASPSLAGALTVRNSTLAFNTAQGGGGNISWRTTSGSGTANVTLTSTIVAKGSNSPNADTSPDLKSGSASLSFTTSASLIGTTLGATVSGSPLTGDPLLGSLQNNGGPTETHALLVGSPALNVGSNPANLTTDQRGAARKAGPGVDIGAFEVVYAPTATVTIDSGSGQRSMIQSLTITFNEPIVFTGAASAAITLQRLASSTIPTPAGLVNLSFSPAAGPATSFTITFNDPTFATAVGSAKSLIDGQYQLLLDASQIKSAFSGLTLDGDGNGTGGDNQTSNFHRLFGDINGDGFTDNVDLVAFRTANGSTGPNPPYDPGFDVNGDNFIDNIDFLAFRDRIGDTP